MESYQSLYLKAHYPLEFMVGVINNFGGFYKTEFYFHEARMNGGQIEAPCVNNSAILTSIQGDQIYMGFIHLKSLEKKTAQAIVEDRERNGAFQDLDNFMRRIEIGLEQLRILVRIGAFRFTGKDKQKLLWEGMLYLNRRKTKSKQHGGQSASPVKHYDGHRTEMLDTEPGEYPLPQLTRDKIEDAFEESEIL